MSSTYNTYLELSEKLAAIESRLASGIQSVTSDGTTTNVNLDALRRERDYLKQQLKQVSPYATMRRPVASRIELGGF